MSHLNKLQSWLHSKRLSGLWITKPENIQWLTGFTGSFAIALIQKRGKNFLITDGRYATKAKAFCKNSEFEFFLYDQDFKEKIAKAFTGTAYGVEDSLTLARFENMKKQLPRINWKTQSDVVEKLRRAKTKTEIQHITQAQNHVDQIFKTFFHQHLHIGVTERELAYKLQQAIEDGGKYELSFDLIVAFGSNSALPHHHNSDRKLQKNENILVDCGAKYQGYCSDMTRNIWFGDQIDPAYQEKYDLLLQAQTSALAMITPETRVKAIDQHCRKCLGAEVEAFTHSLGHGVGLEIHELPNCSKRSKESLIVDEVVTVEPGVYYEGRFGIRIEDLVVVQTDEPRVLSRTGKEVMQISP